MCDVPPSFIDTLFGKTGSKESVLWAVISILKEQENGLLTKDVCRRHGISSATFYKWKAKYGGLNVSDARKLKHLRPEDNKRKKLLAEQMLDNAMLKDIASKGANQPKPSTLPTKRDTVFLASDSLTNPTFLR